MASGRRGVARGVVVVGGGVMEVRKTVGWLSNEVRASGVGGDGDRVDSTTGRVM